MGILEQNFNMFCGWQTSKASSLINCPEKLIYETPSNTKILELYKYSTIVSCFFYIKIILLDELCIIYRNTQFIYSFIFWLLRDISVIKCYCIYKINCSWNTLVIDKVHQSYQNYISVIICNPNKLSLPLVQRLEFSCVK